MIKNKYYNFIDRTGEKHITKEGYEIEIIEYINYNNCTVIFIDNKYTRHATYMEVVRKGIRNPYHPSVCSIGYLGEGTYKTSMNGAHTVCYRRWKNLIGRCYSNKFYTNTKIYKDATVCEEWHNFQNFAKWHEENWKPWMDSSWDLDKDLLVKGNKIYSPETCAFVPQEINTSMTNTLEFRGVYPIGVRKNKNRFEARFGKVYLGSFYTPEEAFYSYKKAREIHIKSIADKWKDKIIERIYLVMYNYQVEITD